MRAALALARRGLGNVWPNPAVGCVIVQGGAGGHVLGRGWTQPGGRPHAETVALERAGASAKGATAYVSLEPCSHHGETGPCVEALVAAGIARVVIALRDPDPRVSGAGVARLEAAGVDVAVGELEAEARALNTGYLTRTAEGRPLFTLKTATTLDGRIATATGESQWITGDQARAWAHLLRARHDAVVTGVGTVRADDPRLTCRLPGLGHRSPLRIVCDAELSIPPDCALVATAGETPVIVATTPEADAAGKAALAGKGIEILELPGDTGGGVDLAALARALGARGLTRVLVEAGAALSTAFVAAGLIDRIAWFRASKLLGGDAMAAIGELGIATLENAVTYERVGRRDLGPDTLETFRRIG